jgi:hypothetical protein
METSDALLAARILKYLPPSSFQLAIGCLTYWFVERSSDQAFRRDYRSNVGWPMMDWWVLHIAGMLYAMAWLSQTRVTVRDDHFLAQLKLKGKRVGYWEWEVATFFQTFFGVKSKKSEWVRNGLVRRSHHWVIRVVLRYLARLPQYVTFYSE